MLNLSLFTVSCCKNGHKKIAQVYHILNLYKSGQIVNKIFWSRLQNNGHLILKFAIVDENTTAKLSW